ncbi:hypothetical protein Hdeb2414_s0082g00780891 [Helianthus debilis subsp. tardiflorus]
MARVLHFEVLFRAFGYDPTLLSFRRFFRLAKNGDWFTFETSQVDTFLISSVVSTLNVWKDRFFWVSEEIVPFKLVWRYPDVCPSRLRPFPEHLLVLLGLSKLWEKRDRDPVLLRDGNVMSALDFIKSDDTSDVAFDDAAATPGEDAVVRGSDYRFEGSSYVNVPNVKGFTKAASSKVSVRRSKRYLKGADQPSGSEAIDLSDDIEGSSAKNVESFEGPEAEEVYVPSWGVKVGDSFKEPAVCAEALAHFAPLGIRGAISKMESDHFISRLKLSSCILSALVAEGVTRFQKGMQEFEDFSKKKEKMKSSMAAIKKEIDGFAKKEEA